MVNIRSGLLMEGCDHDNTELLNRGWQKLKLRVEPTTQLSWGLNLGFIRPREARCHYHGLER